MRYLLFWVIGILVVLIAVILVRTLLFCPEKQDILSPAEIPLNREKIKQDMIDMIRCKTVSSRDESLVDRGEFDKFKALLQERFPQIMKCCEYREIGKTGLLFYVKGKSDKAPTVCMAHYDVVPIEEEGWDKPAFEGILEEDCIWGRGTLDTKGTLCGVTEALEQLLTEGYTPANDLYLSFSGEEEIDGDSCADIVSYLEKKVIKPALVHDEASAVV